MWAERGAFVCAGGGGGSTDLLFLSTVKRCRTLCGPFHDNSSGEIPIIYGYFVPNPEKYCPVKGTVLTLCLSRAYMFSSSVVHVFSDFN